MTGTGSLMPAQPSARSRRGRLHPLLLLAFVSALYLGHVSLYGRWIADDAGISYTYARNLALGHGLVLNPAGERVEGYSNPLWVFLLAVMFRAGLFDPVATPKLLSVTAAVASFVLLGRISERSFGRGDSPLHFVPALALACSVPFTAWSISGLENALYIFLILLAIDLRLAEFEEAERAPASGLVLFLVSITRPEGVLYFAAAFAHGIAAALGNRRVTRRDLLWLAGFAVPFLTYHAWHYSYFADLLPNTYYAKMEAGGPPQHLHEQILDIHSSGWEYLLAGLRDQNLRWLLPAAALLTLLWVNRRRSAGVSLLLLFALVSAFYTIYVGGDWMLQYRFLTPLLAISYLIVGGALLLTVEALTASERGRTLRAAAAGILTAVTTGITLLPARALIDGPVKPPSVSFARIAERGVRFAALAKELRIHDASLMDPDLGGTSYASGLRMIDLAGLADVHIARHDFDPRYFGWYVFNEQRPTFIHTHCNWSLRSQLHQYLDLRLDYLPLWERPCDSSCCPGTLDGEYLRREILVDESPRIEQPLEVTFEGGPTLVGCRLEPRMVQPGGAVHLTTWWTTTSPIAREVGGLRVTPIAPGGTRLAGQDRPFTHGIYPPARWIPGELIREVHELTIPPGGAAGPYEIEVRLTGVEPSAPHVVTAFEVGPAGGAPGPDVERREAELVESSLRKAETLVDAGDLQAATDLLLATRSQARVEERLEAPLSGLSALWYRHGEDLLRAEDAFQRWGEAMSAFQAALACRPANAFARKRIEELRSRDYIERVYGQRLREAQEEQVQGAAPADLLLAIEDEGFAQETDEILRSSAPIRQQLDAEGTLASLSLLHRACAGIGDTGRLAAVQARLDAVAPFHVDLGDRLVYLGGDFEPGGQGSFRITWWFQVTRKMRTDYMISLHAYPDELSPQPEGRAKHRFLNLDHFPASATSTWKPGTIVRHVFSGRVTPGAYRFLFGFFESGGNGRLLVKTNDSADVEMGHFEVR